jgi:hypothetical protein
MPSIAEEDSIPIDLTKGGLQPKKRGFKRTIN